VRGVVAVRGVLNATKFVGIAMIGEGLTSTSRYSSAAGGEDVRSRDDGRIETDYLPVTY
jgi:hypothetical protein